MIELIIKNIKANIAQYTTLFDLTTENKNCTAQSNTLTIAGLGTGRFVLSGGINDIASSGCFNTIHDFQNDVATTDCFFGTDPVIIPCEVHTVNVGEALTRQFALEKMSDIKTPNVIIVYWKNTENTVGTYNDTISQDTNTKIKVDFGVMFRVLADDIQSVGGCDVLDKAYVQSVIETKVTNDSATLVRFDNIGDRFYTGKYLVVDINFSYVEDMELNDIILERAKYFDSKLNTVAVEVK